MLNSLKSLSVPFSKMSALSMIICSKASMAIAIIIAINIINAAEFKMVTKPCDSHFLVGPKGYPIIKIGSITTIIVNLKIVSTR